jgi:predicted DNA-binding transcriptional regulator AlpA
MSEEQLEGPDWLAKYIDMPLSSVYGMNSRGDGPPRIRIGKHIRYRKSDVDAWLASRTVEQTEATAI